MLSWHQRVGPLTLSFAKPSLRKEKTVRFINELKLPFNLLENFDQRKHDLAMKSKYDTLCVWSAQIYANIHH